MNRAALDLAERARARYAKLERQRRDPRYRRVMGRFVAAGLLSSNEQTTAHRGPVSVQDALWAGEVDPRSRMRCFRFSAHDSRPLLRWSRELGATEGAVLRRALPEFGAALLQEPEHQHPAP